MKSRNSYADKQFRFDRSKKSWKRRKNLFIRGKIEEKESKPAKTPRQSSALKRYLSDQEEHTNNG